MRRRDWWKLTAEEAEQIRELAKAECTPQTDIAASFNISPSHVSNIKAGRRWPPEAEHAAPAPGGRKW